MFWKLLLGEIISVPKLQALWYLKLLIIVHYLFYAIIECLMRRTLINCQKFDLITMHYTTLHFATNGSLGFLTMEAMEAKFNRCLTTAV